MYVYIVIERYKYEEERIVAVFDSLEKADDYIYYNSGGALSLECEEWLVE